MNEKRRVRTVIGWRKPGLRQAKQLAIKYQKGLTAMEGKIPDLVCICVPKPDESGKREEADCVFSWLAVNALSKYDSRENAIHG